VSVDTQHHLLVVADHHGPSVGGVENHLPFALVEELLDLVLRDGTLLVKDEHLVGQDPIVEVRPADAAHVSPDGDVTRPDVPGPRVGQVRSVNKELNGKFILSTSLPFNVTLKWSMSLPKSVQGWRAGEQDCADFLSI
jgi:hypothetical protein